MQEKLGKEKQDSHELGEDDQPGWGSQVPGYDCSDSISKPQADKKGATLFRLERIAPQDWHLEQREPIGSKEPVKHTQGQRV